MSDVLTLELDEITNLVAISGNLVTAGQPSEAQMRGLAVQGFKVIINLGLNDPRYCLRDEAGLVESLSMEYRHFPVDFALPTSEDLSRFFDALKECEGKKVFVHCAANFRVSSFISLYAQTHFNWSLEEAEKFIRDIWEPDAVWEKFIQNSRRRLGLSL